MRRSVWGIGAVLFGALAACGGNEPDPGSKVSGPAGGSAGNGQAGSFDLGLGAGMGGGGAGGAGGGGGAAGAVGASGGSAGGASGGSASGGSGSGSGSGGMKPAGMCTRAAASDADCADFWAEEGYTQAYACTDRAAASALPRTIDKQCASVNFVAGAVYGACCTPVP